MSNQLSPPQWQCWDWVLLVLLSHAVVVVAVEVSSCWWENITSTAPAAPLPLQPSSVGIKTISEKEVEHIIWNRKQSRICFDTFYAQTTGYHFIVKLISHLSTLNGTLKPQRGPWDRICNCFAHPLHLTTFLLVQTPFLGVPSKLKNSQNITLASDPPVFSSLTQWF